MYFKERNRSSILFELDNKIRLAYLVDIFERLNTVNKSLQGNNATVMELADKIYTVQIEARNMAVKRSCTEV